ncbi:PREDICTED: synaptotagmin-7-like isoform X2 [Branchiostoma belcheri]|uniref:Synaptotagmin-7 n=1 Tax=Branchiostoma belcheri TaxID=7741 RepID=A0A6P4YFI4_BRABE|nr:PREDICTED: synaptotagmin-7-like isoform X2 [Branchiostoma belcheri]
MTQKRRLFLNTTSVQFARRRTCDLRNRESPCSYLFCPGGLQFCFGRIFLQEDVRKDRNMRAGDVQQVAEDTLLPVVVAAASLVTMVMTLALCSLCQWCQRRDSYTELERDDETSEKGGAFHQSNLITRKTIKFERPPGKAMLRGNVQPNADGQEDDTSENGTTLKMHEDEGSDSNEDVVSEPTANLGRIQFSMSYDFDTMTLVLHIKRAVELPAKDFSGTSDPFVKICLLPDKKNKMETKVKRRNLNPHWNETFQFEGFPYDKLQHRVLYLQVFDYDRFSRNDPIGEVHLPLCEVDLTESPTFWKDLRPCPNSNDNLGELLVSLCYQPTAQRITIVVMKARHLKAMDITGTSDPYVKIWLVYRDKKIEKKKTSCKKRSLNPVFNESFIFDIPMDKMKETSFIISVMDKDTLKKNDVIGKVCLAPRSGPLETKHWKEMISKPRQPVAMWHGLKK